MDSTAAGFLPLVTKASKKRSNNFAETLIFVWNGYSISEKSYTAVNSILIRNLIQVNAFQRTYVICVREPVSEFDLATDWKLCTVHSPSANCVKVIVYTHMRRRVKQLVRNYVNFDIDILTVFEGNEKCKRKLFWNQINNLFSRLL